ncbi:MAG: GTPase, partial [Planctomycetota bacterium]
MVAIVGRPNVGKSSLFNTIVGRRTSIVEPTPGVTRDRVSAICDIDETYFELVDTGGHGVVDRDDLSEDVERQIQYAINQAHLILFVVDAREGLTPLDRNTAELLRRRAECVRLVANKVDEPHLAASIGEFARLGFGEPLPVSALNGSGKWAILELIGERIAGQATQRPSAPIMRIALVGKRNAGKSTFINALAGEPRVIVSEIPGTTRDSIDVRFEKDG